MREQYNTVQRQAIIDCLSDAGGHMTAAAVHAALAKAGRKVSSATVYRQLEKLVDEGIAVKSQPIGEKSACFELFDRSACAPDHCYHMKCLSCGKLIHLNCNEIDELREHMLANHGFHLDMASTVLFGTCESCAKRNSIAESGHANA